MTAALVPANQIPVKLRPFIQQAPLTKWQEELDFCQMEVRFYHRLLKLGIHNCEPPTRTRLVNIMQKLADYEQKILPSLHEKLETLVFAVKQENETTASFQNKLEKHTAQLRQLKMQVFPHLNELQGITLW